MIHTVKWEWFDQPHHWAEHSLTVLAMGYDVKQRRHCIVKEGDYYETNLKRGHRDILATTERLAGVTTVKYKVIVDIDILKYEERG